MSADGASEATSGPAGADAPAGIPPGAAPGWQGWARCLWGIVWREGLRFVQQKERFLSALVRPLVWLFIFAAGFRAVLGLSLTEPYATYVLYDTYVVPGLCAMIQLFQGMQSSLSMVYDRETGAMRSLLISPYPRWFLLAAKLLASVAVSVLQVYAFLGIAWLWGVEPPLGGFVAVLPALILSGLLLGAVGLFLSSAIRQLENFAGVMNFVIFPMFFASSALYPLWKLRESSPLLHDIASMNPFTHAVELIRFSLYLQLNMTALAVVAGGAAAFFLAAVWAYDPARGAIARRRG
ncbi:MAG: ABC transporter permease [Pseudomonadota bacterium]